MGFWVYLRMPINLRGGVTCGLGELGSVSSVVLDISVVMTSVMVVKSVVSVVSAVSVDSVASVVSVVMVVSAVSSISVIPESDGGDAIEDRAGNALLDFALPVGPRVPIPIEIITDVR